MSNLFEFDEIKDIAISVVSISFAFSFLFANGLFGISDILNNMDEFILLNLYSFITIGSGFILHELAHKLVAIYYGAYARFQIWLNGIFFMLFTSALGFLFAAPGAVYIYSQRITVKQNGIISLVGPFTNILISLVFTFLSSFSEITIYMDILDGRLNVWELGARLNLLLALFNMLPVFPLDGSKIYSWNKIMWGGFIFLCAVVGFIIEVVLNLHGFFFSTILSWVFLLLIVSIISNFLFRRVK